MRAELLVRRAYSYYKTVPATSRYSLILDGGDIDMGNENDILAAEAELLEAQGLYARAYEKGSGCSVTRAGFATSGP